MLSKNFDHATLQPVEPSLARPSLGRRIALELRPARPVTWIGPAWATVCGALAAGPVTISGETFLRVVIAVILTDPILGALRTAWVNTDWLAPLQAWRATPARSWMLLPYARLDSPAARLSQWISSRAKFWRSALWPKVGQSISAIIVAGLIALTVALALGTTTFFITMLALVLAPLESELGPAHAGQWPRALAEIGAAWLIGHSPLAPLTWDSVLLALFFAVAYRGLLAIASSRVVGFAIANLAQIIVAIILIWRGAMFNAAFVGLAVVGQALWQSLARRTGEYDSAYLLRVQFFVLASMLIAALGLPR
jgi:hypothetical protein